MEIHFLKLKIDNEQQCKCAWLNGFCPRCWLFFFAIRGPFKTVDYVRGHFVVKAIQSHSDVTL